MASRPPIAVYDACVLYPFHLRNVLIQCAFDGLVEARWTNDIHAEWIRNLAANSTDTPISRFEATRDRMKAVCQSARKTDPLSASKIDPSLRRRDQGLSRRN